MISGLKVFEQYSFKVCSKPPQHYSMCSIVGEWEHAMSISPTYTVVLCTHGKLCSSGEGGTDGKDLPVCTCVCGSAHDCGCVVDGSNIL